MTHLWISEQGCFPNCLELHSFLSLMSQSGNLYYWLHATSRQSVVIAPLPPQHVLGRAYGEFVLILLEWFQRSVERDHLDLGSF